MDGYLEAPILSLQEVCLPWSSSERPKISDICLRIWYKCIISVIFLGHNFGESFRVLPTPHLIVCWDLFLSGSMFAEWRCSSWSSITSTESSRLENIGREGTIKVPSSPSKNSAGSTTLWVTSPHSECKTWSGQKAPYAFFILESLCCCCNKSNISLSIMRHSYGFDRSQGW